MKKNFRDMGRKELEKLEKDLQNDYRKIRFDFVLSAVDNPAEKRTIRRDIARIKTILREMELGIRAEK